MHDFDILIFLVMTLENFAINVNLQAKKLADTLAVETWSEGRDSGTVGRVVLIPADMLYRNQKCKNGFQLPNVRY